MFFCEFCELFKNTCFVEDLKTAGSETPDRSSPPDVFCEKGILRNFAKITGKHLCRRAPANLLKKSLWHRCLPVNFAKFLRIPFFTEHVRWLLLLFYENSWWLVVKKLHHRFLRGFEIYLRQLLQLHKNTTL